MEGGVARSRWMPARMVWMFAEELFRALEAQCKCKRLTRASYRLIACELEKSR
jgi:hypothetical protein